MNASCHLIYILTFSVKQKETIKNIIRKSSVYAKIAFFLSLIFFKIFN